MKSDPGQGIVFSPTEKVQMGKGARLVEALGFGVGPMSLLREFIRSDKKYYVK